MAETTAANPQIEVNDRLTSPPSEQQELQKRRVSREITSVAGAVRQAAERLSSANDEERTRMVGTTVNQLKRLSSRLRKAHVNDLYAEAARVARRQPATFLASSAAAGFALARLFKSSPTPERPGGSAGPATAPAYQTPIPDAATTRSEHHTISSAAWHKVEAAMDWTRDTAEGARRAARNTLPLTLVGIGATLAGIGLIVAYSRSATRVRSGAETSGAQRRISERGMEARAAYAALESSTVVRRRFERTRQSAARAVDDRPLAAGAVALGVGAAIGLLLPDTRSENEWLGEAREPVMEGAQQSKELAMGIAGDAARVVAGTDRDRRL